MYVYLQLLFWKCGKDFLQEANSMQCGSGCPTLNLLDQIFSYVWCSWMMFRGTLTHQQSAALQNCAHSMLRCFAHLTQTTISDNVKKSTDWSTSDQQKGPTKPYQFHNAQPTTCNCVSSLQCFHHMHDKVSSTNMWKAFSFSLHMFAANPEHTNCFNFICLII